MQSLYQQVFIVESRNQNDCLLGKFLVKNTPLPRKMLPEGGSMKIS
jgi:hypothetical protein